MADDQARKVFPVTFFKGDGSTVTDFAPHPRPAEAADLPKEESVPEPAISGEGKTETNLAPPARPPMPPGK